MPKQPILLEARYRSGLEKKVAEQLTAAGLSFDFEGRWVPYMVPARNAKYLPDFECPGANIIIEAKGRFGGFKSDSNGAQERQKLILLKEQHPDTQFRIVFQDARKPIYKGSKTTYAKWATDHGFRFSDKGVLPASWIAEIKQQQESACLPLTGQSASSQARGKSSRTCTRGKASARLKRKSATASRVSRPRSMTCDKRATRSKRN